MDLCDVCDQPVEEPPHCPTPECAKGFDDMLTAGSQYDPISHYTID